MNSIHFEWRKWCREKTGRRAAPDDADEIKMERVDGGGVGCVKQSRGFPFRGIRWRTFRWHPPNTLRKKKKKRRGDFGIFFLFLIPSLPLRSTFSSLNDLTSSPVQDI
jgi:hypothetical protein